MPGVLETHIFHRESFAEIRLHGDHAAQCAALIDALQLGLCVIYFRMMIVLNTAASRPSNRRMQDNQRLHPTRRKRPSSINRI